MCFSISHFYYRTEQWNWKYGVKRKFIFLIDWLICFHSSIYFVISKVIDCERLLVLFIDQWTRPKSQHIIIPLLFHDLLSINPNFAPKFYNKMNVWTKIPFTFVQQTSFRTTSNQNDSRLGHKRFGGAENRGLWSKQLFRMGRRSLSLRVFRKQWRSETPFVRLGHA